MTEETYPQYVGFIAAIIAGFFFGSNYIPVKRYETGNGLYFQWVLCSAIWFLGFLVDIYRNYPPFQPIAMLGGVLWCTGNMLTVPIIKLIGLGIGQVLWGTVGLVVGWSCGAFGILGVTKQLAPSEYSAFSYIGAVLAASSAIVFALIRPENIQPIQVSEPSINSYSLDAMIMPEKDWTSKLSKAQRRIVGILFSVIAGTFYGLNFNPPTYVMEQCTSCSQNGMDYVFSHFTGLFITSTFYFLVYCVVAGKPAVYPEATFPGFISGLMWATAQVCWFIANSAIGLVITYPLVSVLPSLVANFWGIIVFREFSGRRNFIIFGIAYLLSFLSITCTILAKLLH